MLAEAEPEDVDGDAVIVDLEVGDGAGGGVATVAADGEVGVDFDGAVGGFGVGADDAAVLFEEPVTLCSMRSCEAGVLGGVAGEEVEEVPLGHEGDEFGVRGEVREVGDGECFAADGEAMLLNLLVGHGEEVIEEAELVEELLGGGMDGVAAEVAEEVLVLFEDGDVDAGAGEEEAEHHAGGASADDAAGGLVGWWRRHSCMEIL